MKTARRLAAGIMAAAGFAAAAATAEPPSHDTVAGKPSLIAADADKDLKRTSVVAALESELPAGRNVLWCSTMQLAWIELGGVMGAPIRAEGGAAGEFARALNASPVNRGDLDESSFVALAGFGRDGILEKVRAALKEKFGGAASPKLLPQNVAPDTILSYSYLFKNLAFEDPFIRREHPLAFSGGNVASFGLWRTERVENWAKIARQVSILSYRSPTEWTVELKTTGAGDRLVIARTEKRATLDATVAAALGAGGGATPLKMEERDTLIVPIMNFDITRRYREIEGSLVQGSRESGIVESARQNIRLRLDEKGAVLKSEAAIAVATSAAVNDRPREMVCDGPFVVVMMRAGSPRPYLALWVENPEVLVGFDGR